MLYHESPFDNVVISYLYEHPGYRRINYAETMLWCLDIQNHTFRKWSIEDMKSMITPSFKPPMDAKTYWQGIRNQRLPSTIDIKDICEYVCGPGCLHQKINICPFCMLPINRDPVISYTIPPVISGHWNLIGSALVADHASTLSRCTSMPITSIIPPTPHGYPAACECPVTRGFHVGRIPYERDNLIRSLGLIVDKCPDDLLFRYLYLIDSGRLTSAGFLHRPSSGPPELAIDYRDPSEPDYGENTNYLPRDIPPIIMKPIKPYGTVSVIINYRYKYIYVLISPLPDTYIRIRIPSSGLVYYINTGTCLFIVYPMYHLKLNYGYIMENSGPTNEEL